LGWARVSSFLTRPAGKVSSSAGGPAGGGGGGVPEPAISFDEQSRIRLLDVDTARHAEELGREARDFAARVREFTGTVGAILQSLAAEAAVVEAAKARAVGQRNLAAAEAETRRARAREAAAAVDDKLAQLARVTAEADSLARMEAAQRDTIERLSSSELPRSW